MFADFGEMMKTIVATPAAATTAPSVYYGIKQDCNATGGEEAGT
jgi:hypothetical protein